MPSTQKNKKKIAIFTATRAEYGLLYWLMKEINANNELQLQLLVSGTHLSKTHGYTIEYIRSDGFMIDAQIDLQLSDKDARIDVAHAMSLASKGVADVLSELEPDILILLGDRYELLGAASAALIMGIPIFHLHGGEETEGAYDNSIRHAVTKMATWHGVANEEYRERVIQMGEIADNVFNIGAMCLDNIKRLPLLTKHELEQELNFKLDKKTALITFHPVTNEKNPIEGLLELITILEQKQELQIIFTHPNADHGRSEIVDQINKFVFKNPNRSIVRESLGQIRFLSALKHCDVMVGNSSSGIIEAPAMQTVSLNLGSRQKGRHRASTVIDCETDQHSIEQGLIKALTFDQSQTVDNPYGQGNPTQSLIEILTKI